MIVVAFQAVIFLAGSVVAASEGEAWAALALALVAGLDLGMLVAHLLRNVR